MAGVFVSDFTKKTLSQFGWTDKDGIPDELGEFLLKAKDRAQSSTRTDVLIDIDTMLPGDISEAQQMIAKQRVKDKRAKERADFDETTKNMKPEVAAAYAELLTIEEQAPEIIDDREATVVADNPFDSAAFETTPVVEDATTPQLAQELPAKEAPELPIVLPFCPRCGWDMRMKFDTEVSDEDKSDFLATTLGNTRFKKSYSLLGGNFNVTFRSLLADENVEIHKQLVRDHKNEEFENQEDWFLRLFEYRLACSVDTVTNKVGLPIAVMPTLDALQRENTAKHPMVELRKQMQNVLAQEITRRLVAAKCREFQRIIEALEAMTLDPSFWDGIG
jgi:hypothetical protein